jgi:hypothetical protein
LKRDFMSVKQILRRREVFEDKAAREEQAFAAI